MLDYQSIAVGLLALQLFLYNVLMNRRKRKVNLKNLIWHKSNGVCAKCGKPTEMDKRTIDHFIPKYHGGTDDISNLIPMCRACNRAKSSRLMSIEECCPYLLDEYKEELKKL